jgi:poly-gamma-glutamate capsule biosynthesis protein CapA/YwtB (metallophosphatase superfamily)
MHGCRDNHRIGYWPLAFGWLVLLAALGGAACGESLDFDVKLRVVDESGDPVKGAVVVYQDREYRSNSHGEIGFHDLMGATLAVVTADGYLSEPVIIGRSNSKATVEVRLFASLGGQRWAMHSSGDVMFGRRYNQPLEGEPLIDAADPGPGSRAVVAHVAPAFRAADFSTINLETVVSTMAPAAAYPGKRFILNSLPGTLEALDELGVDVVDLANNHARDFMDVGVAASVSALDAAGVPYFGAGVDQAAAETPYVTQVAGVTVAMLGWTTVNGSFVNDNYPDADAPLPDDIQPTELWQYVQRSWGYQGEEWDVPVADRRIGEVWRMFEARESQLSDAALAEVWESIAYVYPEMQDWVARRGHGGAANWVSRTAQARIAEMDAVADVVVVQLHSGFQFQRASSAGTRLAARRAIDAGADIVICHHPHVLQGADWYKGKLIVYSLGNFVFDQDFLATFPSTFLRTVWDGDTLLEARFLPVELIGYKTRPVADAVAARTLLGLWEMSIMRAEAARDDQDDVRVFALEPDADTTPATMRLERNTALIVEREPALSSHRLRVPAGRVQPIGYQGLIDPRLGLSADNEDFLVARDLFGWGRFEDEVADQEPSFGSHWALDDQISSKEVQVDGDTPEGVAYIRLSRYYTNDQSVVVRPVARIPLWRHRLYRDVGGGVAEPMDPEPTYSLYFRARRKGSGAPSIRLDLFQFDDTDPTEDPSSMLVDQFIEEIAVPNDNRWHTIHMEIPASVFETDMGTANMVLLYLRLEPPYKSKTTLDIDELRFLEWRNAAGMPDRLGVYDFVRNLGAHEVVLDIPVLPAQNE